MNDLDPAYLELLKITVRIAAIWLLILCAAWLAVLETKDRGDKS